MSKAGATIAVRATKTGETPPSLTAGVDETVFIVDRVSVRLILVAETDMVD
jgi:hypothetical protein